MARKKCLRRPPFHVGALVRHVDTGVLYRVKSIINQQGEAICVVGVDGADSTCNVPSSKLAPVTADYQPPPLSGNDRNQVIAGSVGIPSGEAFGGYKKPGTRGRPPVRKRVSQADPSKRRARYEAALQATGFSKNKLADTVRVPRKDIRSWLDGKIPDDSETSMRIENALDRLFSSADLFPPPH